MKPITLNITGVKPEAIRQTFVAYNSLPYRELFDPDDMSLMGEPIGHIPRISSDLTDTWVCAAVDANHLHVLWRDADSAIYRCCIPDALPNIEDATDADIERYNVVTNVLDSLPLITRLRIEE
jgi:hypothetical protein